MKLFKLTTAIAIAFAAVSYVDGNAAYGDTFQTRLSGGDWNINNTWEEWNGNNWVNTGDHPDQTDDVATILSGDTVTVLATDGDAATGTLTINDSGTAILDMQDGGVLEINTALTISGSGVFKFNQASGGGAVQPILRATSDLVISGTILTVDTKDLGGKIEMDANQSVQLSSGTISSEFGPIVVEADFENDSTVTANGGTDGYDITFTRAILAGSAGLFQVTDEDSEMIFNLNGAATITSGADFNVEDGLMHFKEDVTTDGGYRQIGGKIQADSGDTFTATGAYP